MHNRIKVIDIELIRPLVDIAGLEGYVALQALVRLHGAPIGYVKLPVTGGVCSSAAVSSAILKKHSRAVVRHLLCDALGEWPWSDGLRITGLSDVPHPAYNGPLPLVTVAVCTRDRTVDLARCLESLIRLDYPALDILVIDNAPGNDVTERLVRTKYPNVRYVCEPRPGLDWARNRAIIEARGEIIAYTDDDTVADSGWVKALVSVFAENAEVMLVTGLVVPYELETDAQVLFERNGGFGRGFERKWCRVDLESGERAAILHGGTGRYGTGANMAYRRSLFEKIGYFDPALDVGTVTNGGGDLEMFFRVLKYGYTLVYEPGAVVRHCHRRDYEQLRRQLATWGTAFYAYIIRNAFAYPDERLAFVRLGLRWLWRQQMRPLFISFVYPSHFPRDMILAKLKGSFHGLCCYQKARRIAANIANTFGPLPQVALSNDNISRRLNFSNPHAVAVRTVDLSRSLLALTDVTAYRGVRVFVTRHDKLLGSVDIANHHQSIGVTRLCEAIADQLGRKLLKPDYRLSTNSMQSGLPTALASLCVAGGDEEGDTPARLNVDIPVSVIIATRDQPEDLRNCLRCLAARESSRRVEIIVVDNNPASGLTASVVAEFPGVVLVNEQRRGLSYARNKGFFTSKGDIVITIDDDVTMPPDWLEKLVVPFIRSDVVAVTGNVLPMELDTSAQRFFDVYGGLGRGFEQFVADGDWFKSYWCRAVPVWKVGTVANAAFRASIFRDSRIGMMDEALGAGMPSGGGDDTRFFYKILRAGYTIVYEPSAYVWHKRCRDISSLRRQLYSYGKGQVACHLTTLIFDHDLRAMIYLLIGLPGAHFGRIKERLRGRSVYPLSLFIIEVAGNLAGPFALWRSRRRVRRGGIVN